MADSDKWQVINADDFQVPVAPTVTKVQQRWKRFLRLLGLHESKPEEEDNDDKQSPINKEFDRNPAIKALNHHFKDWVKNEESTVSFLIDPPFSCTDDIARDWAKQKKWKLLTPPDIAKIRNVDIDGWWKEQKIKTNWTIDNLTDYLIRTPYGLSFIRELLPRMLYGKFGKGLVVCDSWMFAFIQRIWPLKYSRVYCFAAAGPELLKQVGIHASDKTLQKLIARVHGNIGIALAIRSIEENDNQKLPELPAETNDITSFILYSVLLHRHLSGNLLQEILAMIPAEELNLQLLQLKQYGILNYNENQWKINIEAYLTVRNFLNERDFLLDIF
jgi:hypothetical protein